MRRTAVSAITRAAVLLIYSACLALYACLRGMALFRRRRREPVAAQKRQEYRLLVIGTFYTRNWCLAHLTPICRAHNVREVCAVVDGPTAPLPKVTYTYPPYWMVRLLGRAIAKLIWAAKLAVQDRPDLVMGYHLLPGAMTALLVGTAVGARTAYQMTAGPVELIGGGFATENFFLKNLLTNSPICERLAHAIARRMDLIVVRGERARRFVARRALGGHVCIVPGSVSCRRFRDTNQERIYDVVSVCRLVPVKQPDHLLEVFKRLAIARPSFRGVVLGDGPMLGALRTRADELGLSKNVEFLGHTDHTEVFLKQSKCFLLTSRSEGLSIAMAEAMIAGVVPVVADVGDLGDLVRNGKTGWLVRPGAFDEYADRILRLMADEDTRADMSQAAQDAATRHNSTDHVAGRWAATLALVCDEDVVEYNPASCRLAQTRLQPLVRRRLWDITPRTIKHCVQPLANIIGPEWWLGSRFREWSDFCRSAEFWPRDVAEAYQLSSVKAICTLASERSDYHRRIFLEMGFDPRDLQSLADLRRLPMMDKECLRKNLESLCTVDPSRVGVDRVSTGGTGGLPLVFYINRDRSVIEYAYLCASWRRARYDLTIPQAVFRGAIVCPNAFGLRHEFDPLLRRHCYSNFHMTDAHIRGYLEHLSRFGPCFLHGYPSSIDALARFLERTGQRAPDNIRGILVGSESVYPHQRRLAEHVFGVRYFSWYGHTEKVVMAAECEHSTDLHVWPTYGYFELLDEDGIAVDTPGERGEIVGTGFLNTVVPFIRYRTGDYATFVANECSACGREHPIIRDVRGHRSQEILVASDGSLISWTAINMHDDTFSHVRQLQFSQSVAGQATLRLVPANGFGDADVERIRRNLAAKLDGRLTVEIELTDSIPLSPRGKSIFVEQKLDLDREHHETSCPELQHR